MSAGDFANTTIGHYRLLDFIGAGGMGEVYRAAHVRTGEIVAVKLLLNAQGADMLQRFRNEARIHAALRHPNIAAMREFIESDDAPAIAMEYIEGDSLESRIRQRGGLSPREALPLFAAIVDAVGYMHQRGVLHRDIKSSNVKIARDGSPRLLDFGIAKSAQSPKLTAAGAVIGTWHYLSPEQLRSGIAESRSDLWALGVLLYEMLTGRLPFDGGGVAQLTERILAADYSPASRSHRSVSPAVDRIIAQCLTVRLEARYQTASAILSDLQSISAPTVTPAAAPRAPARAMLPVPLPLSPMLASFRARAAAWGIKPERREQLQMLSRQHASTVTVVLGLATVVGLFAYSLTPRDIKHSDADTLVGRDTVAVVPGPVELVVPPTVFDYSPTPVTDSQTVSVKTLELPAEVWIEGRKVGTTPFTVTRQIGSEVQLILKRPGYRDSLVKFPVLIGKPEYSYQLERVVHENLPEDGATPLAREAPPKAPAVPAQSPLDAPPLALAGAALFFRRLFGGNGSSGAPAIKSTQELTAVDASGARPVLRSESGIATDTGCVRTGNEDAIRVIRPDAPDQLASVGVLAVVCDGMGGHEGGEVASRLAIDAIEQHFREDAKDPAASLARAVEKANRTVYDASQQDEKLKGMGTTCTALLVKGDQAYCAHVGDSRLYLVRDRDIFLMTEDHSEVMELVRRGIISREEARHHPDKNVILRALGVRRDVQVTSWPQPFGVRANDRFLICSDGLYDLVEDADILGAVLSYGTQEACDRLVSLARDHGGFDNISVAVLAMSASSNGSAPVKATRVVEVTP
ncbi:MAG: Stp1/IreP family PP2C-type Ser/Thr phosphatase [Gemmatimonadaceae bacterium]|nr:Stp1/IreP family PP2C-type Ser/Thr phosphatase [Gemmatimonadaceae bacterium]